jgi:uncharacterized OB-fold protein
MSTPAPTSAKPQAPKPEDEFVFIDGKWSLTQTYRSDPLLDRFFVELKAGRLMGGKVPESGRVMFPPRSVCELSYRKVEELVPVGPGGTIRGITKAFSNFGGLKPPYIVAFVQLDNTDMSSPAFLRGDGTDVPDLLSLVGKRCRVVIKDQPAGEWADFWYELEA